VTIIELPLTRPRGRGIDGGDRPCQVVDVRDEVADTQSGDVYRIARGVEQLEPDLEFARVVGADLISCRLVIGDARGR
jgi:hypothetical protein